MTTNKEHRIAQMVYNMGQIDPLEIPETTPLGNGEETFMIYGIFKAMQTVEDYLVKMPDSVDWVCQHLGIDFDNKYHADQLITRDYSRGLAYLLNFSFSRPSELGSIFRAIQEETDINPQKIIGTISLCTSYDQVLRDLVSIGIPLVDTIDIIYILALGVDYNRPITFIVPNSTTPCIELKINIEAGLQLYLMKSTQIINKLS